MLAFLREWSRRWSDWCGDADMEKAIRRHLSDNGYYGGSAKLRDVRLAAVQRPGWLQVFRFDATAKLVDPSDHEAEPSAASSTGSPSHAQPAAGRAEFHELFGLVREDHRHGKISVRVFRSGDQRRQLFASWGDGLLQLRGGQALKSD